MLRNPWTYFHHVSATPIGCPRDESIPRGKAFERVRPHREGGVFLVMVPDEEDSQEDKDRFTEAVPLGPGGWRTIAKLIKLCLKH